VTESQLRYISNCLRLYTQNTCDISTLKTYYLNFIASQLYVYAEVAVVFWECIFAVSFSLLVSGWLHASLYMCLGPYCVCLGVCVYTDIGYMNCVGLLILYCRWAPIFLEVDEKIIKYDIASIFTSIYCVYYKREYIFWTVHRNIFVKIGTSVYLYRPYAIWRAIS